MKRILLRMSVLAAIITLGLITIAQAQRRTDAVASPKSAVSATTNSSPTTPKPAGNPLRSPNSRQTADLRNTATQTATDNVAMPTPAPAAFSLADATNTGMTPPPVEPLPTLASPVPPNFDPPVAAGIVANPAASVPMAEPFPSASATMLPADTATVAGPPAPTGGYLAEPDLIPQQIQPPSEAQPMNRSSAPPTFAESPIQPALSGPQMASGTGRPGTNDQEGAQTPQLVVEKVAPVEIQVGRPAIFEIHVRNVGTVAAKDVEVRDEIPQGTRLQSTKPQALQGAEGGLVWKIGTLNPNQDVVVEMELMPTEEGEIGSVATVHFQAEASVRAKVTRPMLAVETEVLEKVLKGENLTLKIRVTNPGTGIAENVVLEEHVPDGFRHPAGADLEYEVGTLAPKESRELTLVLEAVHPGQLVNVITARGEPSLRTEHRSPIEVIAPKLEVDVQGPSRRFLECEAVYNLSVRNPGTAPAKQVELAVEVPAGMKFVSGTNRAYYEEATRTVHWMLEEIPVQAGPPPVQLTLMPVEAGQHKIRLVSSDDSGAKAEVEQAVLVEGIVAMYFEVADLQDPIEVGGQTLYEIRVVNQGSKEATNVRLVAEVPPNLRAIAAEAPNQQAPSAQGNTLVFEPLPRLAAKADVTYRVRVEGVQPGDVRMRVQVTTDEIPDPITKEESTRVYSPQ